MNKIINIEKSDHELLKNILKKYKYKFYAYGSRVKNNSRRYSDLDLFCKKKISNVDMIDLIADLEESDITIKIDVVDIDSCSQKFYNLIIQDLVEIN